MASQAVAHKPDTQEMVIVHRVFRREFRLAPQMVRRVASGDVAQAGIVTAHLTEMATMLHHHHSGEDDLVWPRLHERAELSDDLIERMERQHEQVAALLHRVDDLLPRWGSSADAELREELASVLDSVSGALEEHLAEEEREVLPLIEQHLTPEEWAELGQRGMAAIAKPRMLVVLGHILEETSPQERKRFLEKAPPPARLAFRLFGQRKYAAEVAQLRQGITIPQPRQG